jgi:chromosome segregation ATPase
LASLKAKLTQLQELLDPASPEITNRIAEIEHLEMAKNSRIPLGTQLQRKLNQVKGLDQRMGKLQTRIKTKEDQRDEIHKDLSELQEQITEL